MTMTIDEMRARKGMPPIAPDTSDHLAVDPDTGARYAGTHVLCEFYQCELVPNHDQLLELLAAAADEAGASVLESVAVGFPGGGATAMCILAESHISAHTWPEHAYVAADIFMCGACDPHDAAAVLERWLGAAVTEVTGIRRGTGIGNGGP